MFSPDFLRPVQMPERDIIKSFKHRAVNRVKPADRVKL
jgi:hypothetical protein